jgi:hypothetical protein
MYSIEKVYLIEGYKHNTTYILYVLYFIAYWTVGFLKCSYLTRCYTGIPSNMVGNVNKYFQPLTLIF